jgi:hypothetical protein
VSGEHVAVKLLEEGGGLMQGYVCGHGPLDCRMQVLRKDAVRSGGWINR